MRIHKKTHRVELLFPTHILYAHHDAPAYVLMLDDAGRSRGGSAVHVIAKPVWNSKEIQRVCMWVQDKQEAMHVVRTALSCTESTSKV